MQAHNARGWSAISPANTVGAQIQTVPSIMAAPTRDPLTSNTQLVVDWVALTSPQNGASPVLSYGVMWDQGINSWTELVGISADFTGT